MLQHYSIQTELKDLANKSGACIYTKGPQMVRKCRVESELMKFTTLMPNVKTFLEMTYTKMGHVLQKWSCDWNPMCDFKIAPHHLFIRKMKADCEICPGEHEQNTFAAQFYQNGTNPYDFGIAEFEISEMLQQAEVDYSNISAIWGLYDDDPAATSSPFNVMDGLFAQTRKHIDAEHFCEIPTGVPTKENIWDMMKMFRDRVHPTKKTKFNLALVSCKVYFMLLDALLERGVCGVDWVARHRTPIINEPIFIPGVNMQICPLVSFGDSDAIIVTSKDNIYNLADMESDMNNLWVERNKRKLCIFHDRKGGIGYACPDKRLVLVNDQIPTLDQLGLNASNNFDIPAVDLAA